MEECLSHPNNIFDEEFLKDIMNQTPQDQFSVPIATAGLVNNSSIIVSHSTQHAKEKLTSSVSIPTTAQHQDYLPLSSSARLNKGQIRRSLEALMRQECMKQLEERLKELEENIKKKDAGSMSNITRSHVLIDKDTTIGEMNTEECYGRNKSLLKVDARVLGKEVSIKIYG
ncbi:hypothetical protein MTR_2g104620 [Medicago truncatula]|uniref:Uncharacterized protein n=1 Tax=Medicago truncatula TaxID=3880 RepID=G7IMC2_MEDTR|nr:hypothetical protein MTR_2g104620 [Medicago truncatula]